MRIRSDSNGTKADLNPGDMIELGYKPNYGKRRMAAYVYLTATLSGLSDLVSRQSRTESGRGLRQDEATTQVWPANVRFGSKADIGSRMNSLAWPGRCLRPSPAVGELAQQHYLYLFPVGVLAPRVCTPAVVRGDR